MVPRVVDVVDKSELHIKETVFNAIDGESVNQSGTNEDKQIFVNVVKSKIESEAEVPQILSHLKELMLTGGSAVDSWRAESREGSIQIKPFVINIIIFNIIKSVTEKPANGKVESSSFFRDTYIDALNESRKPISAVQPHSGPHFIHTDDAINQPAPLYYQVIEPEFIERPMTVMEKDYARPVQPVDQTVEDETTEEEIADEEITEEEAPPYFTETEDVVEKPTPQVVIPPARRPARRPGAKPVTGPTANRPGIRMPAALNGITKTAGNVVRKNVRTIGFVAVPIMAGLAGTVNMWLPALSLLGRKKRSMQEEGDWEHSDNRDRAKAIEDEGILALLMGKRYLNATKEALQESIDNWKNRDQEAVANAFSSGTRLASTSRPQWVRYPSNQRTTTVSDEELKQASKTTVKRSTDAMEYVTPDANEVKPTTRRSIFPMFYSALFNKDPNKDQVESASEEIPSASPSTDADTYVTDETEERLLDSNVATISAYQQVPSSGGFDFDIVANFVKSTLSKMVTDDTSNPENREEIFVIKSPSIVNSSSTLSLKNGATIRVPSSEASTVSVFTAMPLMPNWTNESPTNSPVNYIYIQPAKGPGSTTQMAELNFEIDDADSDIPGNENVEGPVEFFEDEAGQIYATEAFFKSTNKPIPSKFFVNPSETPNTFRPTTENVLRSTKRPASLITINNFKTPKPNPPASVDVSSTVTTLKFNHNGIVTTPPLQDFSTYTGESSLVSDTVDKQNILAGLLKGATSPSPLDVSGSNSNLVLANRPGNSNVGETGNDWNGISSPGLNTATYDPFSSTGIADELDVSSLITQLQTNLTTGLVTKPPAGLHYVNSSTDIVIINPFDATPATIFSPFDIEAVVAEEEEDTQDTIIVDADFNPPPANFVPAIPSLPPVANIFFSSGSSGGSSGSSVSSGGSSTSSSSSSIASGFISSLTTSSGLGPIGGLLAALAAAILAISLPIWVPFIGKKKRRTYGPARKKTYKPPKKTYSHPKLKKTYGEPPPNHYNDDGDDRYDDDFSLTGTTSANVYTNSELLNSNLYDSNNADSLFSDPGSLNSEDIYGPPATVFLNAAAARRRRRSAFRPPTKLD